MAFKRTAFIFISGLSIGCFLLSCHQADGKRDSFRAVTHGDFKAFIAATGYVTDAEKYGWSIVQQDVFNFITVDSADWRKPDGASPPASDNLPVTQVSYNDAMAYCQWSNTRLPTYEEYWKLIKTDKRKVVTDLNAPISSTQEVNILGNVWEITSTRVGGNIRLAGGSLFCSPTTCYGTSKERELLVDKETGNVHIGFGVVEKI
ncbi:MAG: SUMF1/EgtB/PvdO family nonheme iron enzyme [Bacteroidota bacterium]